MAVSASLQGDIGENLKTVVVIKSSKGFGFGIHKENPVVINKVTESKRQVRLLLRPAGACSQVDKRQSDASTLKRERNYIADEVGDASLDRRPSAVSAADFNGDSDSPLGAQLASLKLKYRQSVIGLPRHWRSHKASKIENNSDKDRATASRAEDCHKIMEEKFDQETCAVAPSAAETDSPVQEQQQQQRCNNGQFSDSDTESHSSVSFLVVI
uniref:PDZ domain-containing protein n=1 Tax=Macrostomum lignano TaxID=282301 RepID=A0A1I8HJA1_9PLAT